ncbi:hypothetical protein N665_0098s0053 [Sinapis alba]|nr:hypothetical protein N665_0098s0053 [Sinapis alba]
MSYNDVEIKDIEWNEEIQAYTYPCPCGDLFQITKEDLRLGEEIANCPSCSLYITVIYNMEDFQNDTKTNNEPKTRSLRMVKLTILRKITAAIMMMVNVLSEASHNNVLYSLCSDTQISKGDGFPVGVAISSKEAFFLDQVQLSPCDSRLGLAAKMDQLVPYRPEVDEISLLSMNTSTFKPSEAGGYMVGFAGSKYAARSYPVKVADGSNTITDFTLVMEFQKGLLQKLTSSSVCLNGTDCAVTIAKCRARGGEANCNIRIQVAFSGTDKNLESLNSWYEVNNLRQYSLTELYANAVNSLSGGLL